MSKKTQRPRPGDQTGKVKAQLAEENAEAIKEAAQRMAVATAAVEAEKDEVVDLTEDKPKPVEPEVLDAEVKDEAPVDPTIAAVVAKAKSQPEVQEVGGVVDAAPSVVGEDKIKVVALYDLERSTIGDRSYVFEEGRKYVVPRNVFNFLAERGYLREA